MADFEILIEKRGDELEMKLVSENPAGEQENRRNGNSGGGGGRRNRKIKKEKRKRRHHQGTHEDASGIHQTIILLDNDTVVFKCNQAPFVVDVEFDPDYLDPEKDPPRRSPFAGWDTPQKSTSAAGVHSVPPAVVDDTSGSGADKPSDYLFYKCTVWSQELKLDPDFFCDR